MSLEEDAEDRAEELIQATVKQTDLSEQEIQEKIEEQLEEFREHQSSEAPEAILRKHAASVVKNRLTNLSGGQGSFADGEAEELPILTMGFQRKEAQYFVTDEDALLASGIINPKNDPAGYAIFIINSADGLDLEYCSEVFMPLNTVRGAAAFRRVGSRDGEPSITKNGQPTYLVDTTPESKFEIVDPDDLPDSDPLASLPAEREAKREMIHQNFIGEDDTFTLETYPQHKSAVNDNGYAVAFGIDVKRFRGEVVDGAKFESGDGVMTLVDDTVFSEDDIPEDLVSDNTRTPGLQVSCAGDLLYGENSILDIYGYVEQRNDTGQYRMQALGIIPVVEFEFDGYDGTQNSSSAEDDAAQEDTI